MQNFYGTVHLLPSSQTVLHAGSTYRSQRDILDHLNRLLTLDRPIAEGSALGGSEGEILTYADTAGLVA